MEDRGLHLALQIPGGYGGEFASAWRLPGVNKTGFIDADVFVAAAKEAERGKLDAVFLADRAAIEDDLATSAPRSALEPVVLLALMARETSHVGLVATSSTTYNYPYNVARQFRALDLVSGGRIGWNAVTTSSPLAALNFAEEVPTRGYRYGRAHEFVTAVQALWGSWQDDALVLDAERGVFADMGKITPVGLVGRTLATRGPINLPPSAPGTAGHLPGRRRERRPGDRGSLRQRRLCELGHDRGRAGVLALDPGRDAFLRPGPPGVRRLLSGRHLDRVDGARSGRAQGAARCARRPAPAGPVPGGDARRRARTGAARRAAHRRPVGARAAPPAGPPVASRPRTGTTGSEHQGDHRVRTHSLLSRRRRNA